MTMGRGRVFATRTDYSKRYKPTTLVENKKHDNHTKGPSFTIGVRHKQYPVDQIPGPKLSQTPVYRDGAADSPKYTIRGLIKEKVPDSTPSPLIYNPERSHTYIYKSAPKISISLPLRSRSGDPTPPPKYDLPAMLCETKQSNKTRAPAYSMSFKGPCLPKSKTPGPCDYTAISPNIYCSQPPAYSFHFRTKHRERDMMPGPGTYSPENVWAHKKKGPQFTFGVRRPQHIEK